MRERITTYLADPKFKRRLYICSGLLAESLAFRIMELEGFKVGYFSDPPISTIKDMRLMGFYREWRKRNIKHSGLPDLMAEKGNQIYAIEVKTGKSRLSPSQAKTMKIAKKHNFKTYILRMKINVEVKEVDFIDMKLYPKRNAPTCTTLQP